MAAADDQGAWLDGYLDRVTSLLEQSGRVGGQLASEWGERSIRDPAWTVDSLTSDMIDAWDRLTPVAEQGIELWLEAVQRAVRPGGQP